MAFLARVNGVGSYLSVGLVTCAAARHSSHSVCAVSGPSGGQGVAVRVASYNVLSDSLCRASHYSKGQPDDLDNDKRLARVKAQLQAEIDKGAVICLQVCVPTTHWN